MEEEFYSVVKLKNGEELFSHVCPTVEDNVDLLLLYYPITITRVRTKEGLAYSVEPWIKIGNESIFPIRKEDILTMSEIEDEHLIELHNRYVSTREDDTGNISFNDAIQKLERIYNGS
jgi:hypothetical protein